MGVAVSGVPAAVHVRQPARLPVRQPAPRALQQGDAGQADRGAAQGAPSGWLMSIGPLPQWQLKEGVGGQARQAPALFG